jgi:leucine dehydrogenase
VFDLEGFASHERVLHVHDSASGLRAIIAIHSTALGPACGGCRLWTYDSASEALTDALRLSQGMSYKNALAGVPFGGGKAVILGPVAPERRSAVLSAFGRAVHTLAGDYVTAEDVGVGVRDMEVIATQTPFVSGLAARKGGAGGDPSPYTARGVRCGIEAAAEHALGRSDLEGLRVAVQGLGRVGGNLCRELAERGARLVVADLDGARVEQVCDELAAEPAGVGTVLLSEVDLVAPCALGSAITPEVARQLRARVVAGAANNQLATPEAGRILHERRIAYAPDYLINAGGIILIAGEYFGDADAGRIEAAVDRIGERTRSVLHRSATSGRPTHTIVDEMAQARIAEADVA